MIERVKMLIVRLLLSVLNQTTIEVFFYFGLNLRLSNLNELILLNDNSNCVCAVKLSIYIIYGNNEIAEENRSLD